MADDLANEVADTIADAITFLEKAKIAYSKSKDITDLPDAFGEVLKKVDLVKGTLKSVEDYVSGHVYDQKSYREMKTDVESCKKKAENLQTLFRKVVPPSNKSKLDRYREAARALGGVGENRVETLMVRLLGDVQNLVPKCTIQQDGNTDQAEWRKVVDELAVAAEELSAMEPSLLEDPSGNSVNNWSTGTQNVNTGEGTQNNNTGTGMQYIGQTQTFNSHSPTVPTQK